MDANLKIIFVIYYQISLFITFSILKLFLKLFVHINTVMKTMLHATIMKVSMMTLLQFHWNIIIEILFIPLLRGGL